jgi:hypothetical protein
MKNKEQIDNAIANNAKVARDRMLRINAAIAKHEANPNPHWGHVGDTLARR